MLGTAMRRAIVALEPLWILGLGLPLTLPNKIVSISWHPYLLFALFLFWPLRWYNYVVDGWEHRQNQSREGEGTDSPLKRSRISRLFLPLQSPISLPILLIVAWLPINLWAAVDRQLAFVATGYLLFGLTLVVALINWAYLRQHPNLPVWLLLLIGCILAIVAPPFVAWKPEYRLFSLPLYDWLQTHTIDIGETIHANVLASVLILSLPILIAIVLLPNGKTPRWKRYGAIGLIILLISVLIITQSRGGYLSTCIACTFLITRRWPRVLWGLPFLLVLVGIMIYQIGPQIFLDELSPRGAIGGWTGRVDIWNASLQAITDFSFTGIGIGTFSYIIPLLYPLQVNIKDYPHAHNLFLQIGVNLGVPGLIAYVALLLNISAMLWQLLRRTRFTADYPVVVGICGAFIAMLVDGIFSSANWDTKLAFVPWLLMAAITVRFLSTNQFKGRPS